MDIFKNIADSKSFQAMPKGAQVLYFYLADCADKQGKVSQKDLDKIPLILLHRQGNTTFEMELLKEKGYITVSDGEVTVTQAEEQQK